MLLVRTEPCRRQQTQSVPARRPPFRPMPGQVQRVAALAQATPQVVECPRLTGEDCFIVKAHLDALESLDPFLDQFLAYGQTTTSIVQSSPVPPREPPLPV
jgi:Lrp/AsnC family leucine-responsive transcriptional regulator